MKSLLPLILIVLLLTGAITYVLSKNTLPKVATKQEAVSPNELEVDSFMTPTPTATPTLAVTATPTPKVEAKAEVKESKGGNTTSVVPTITVKKSLDIAEPKGGVKEEDVKIVEKDTKKVIAKTAPVVRKVTKHTVCTPVYGAADTCVEHEVVDTAGGEVLFFNLAGLSYLAGLTAFVKAKKA